MDFYNIYNVIIISDMHILKEIYFHINSLEFVLISIFLILCIFNIYALLNILLVYEYKTNNYINKNTKIKHKNNSIFFFKIQNYNKQINTAASSRV